MTFGERLKKLREENGLLLADLSDKFGLSKTAFSNYENDYRKPGLDLVKELAEFFGVSVDYLLGVKNPDEVMSAEMVREHGYTSQKELEIVPVLGNISAGLPILAQEHIIEYKKVPYEKVKGADYFYLKVQGNSMINAGIHDQDEVLIRRQPEVENGDIAAVLIDNEATLKRLYHAEKKLILQPENPKYKPIVLDHGNVRILGKAVEVAHKL